MHHPSRGGVRGGQDQFEWESVKTDKHRENYLGHSVMAPVGRWQKGKDLTWYAKDKETKMKEQKTERNKIKQLEEEAMAAALGFGTVKKKTSNLTKQEIAETLKRGQTERDSGNVERVEGMGFGSSRAAMMDSSRSNDSFVKLPEVKIQQVANTPGKESAEDESKDEHKKRKKKKKHKVKKSKEISNEEKRKNESGTRRRKGSESEEDSDARETSSRNRFKETKTSSKREKSRNGESEEDNRLRRKDKYKELRNEPIKRKRRHDSGSSNDDYQRSKVRESRTSRRRERHDSD